MEERKNQPEMTEAEMREQIALLTRRIYELERAVDKHGIERENIYAAPQVQKEVYSSSQSEAVYKSGSGKSVYSADNGGEVYKSQSSRVVYSAENGQKIYTADNSGDVYKSQSNNEVYTADNGSEVYVTPEAGRIYNADVNRDVYARIKKTEELPRENTVVTSGSYKVPDNGSLQSEEQKAGTMSRADGQSAQTAENKTGTANSENKSNGQGQYVFQSSAEKAQKNSEKNEAEDNIRLEKALGKNIMLIAASLLVFIGVILFAIVIIPEMNDTIKQVMMYVGGLIVAGVGAVKYKKNPENKWFLGLWACGMGVLFIALLVSHLYFESFSELTLYIMLAIWSVIVAVISKREGAVFFIINQLGIGVAITLASAKLIYDGDDKKLLLLLIYFLVTEIFTNILSLKKEYGKNLIQILGFVYNLVFINIAVMINMCGFEDSYSRIILILTIVADLIPIVMSLFYHEVDDRDAFLSCVVDSIMFGMAYLSVWCVCGLKDSWLYLLIFSAVIFAVTDLCIFKRNESGTKELKERTEDIIWKCFPALGIIISVAASDLAQSGILMSGIAVILYIYGKRVSSVFNEIVGKIFFTVGLFLPMKHVVMLIIAVIVFVLTDYLERKDNVVKIIWKLIPAFGIVIAVILIDNPYAAYIALGISVAVFVYSQLADSVFNRYFAGACFVLSLFFDMVFPVRFAGALIMLVVTDYFDREEHLAKILWKLIPSLTLLGAVLGTKPEYASVLIFVFALAFIVCGFCFASIYNRCQGLLWYVALIYVAPPSLLLVLYSIIIITAVLVLEEKKSENYNVFDKITVYIISMIAFTFAAEDLFGDKLWYILADSFSDSALLVDLCDLLTLSVLAGINILLVALPQMRKSAVTKKNELEILIVFTIFNSIAVLAMAMEMDKENTLTPAFLAIAIILCLITSWYMIKNHPVAGTVHAAVKFLLLLLHTLVVYEAADYLLSVILMLYAVLVLAIGFAFEKKYKESFTKLRIPALVLTLLCILKLLILDFSYDSTLLRALSYLFAGILCFVISFIYTKLDKKMTAGIDPEKKTAGGGE